MPSTVLRDESELTAELLSTGAFHCATCKNLLQPPVWLTSDKKNLCNSCYRHRNQKQQKAIENTAFRLILQTLRFPCPHRSKGCQEMLDNKRYQQHVHSCPHRHACLVAGCQWAGAERSLMMHLLDDHEDIELKETDDDDGAFPIGSDLAGDDVINVIHTWLGRFVTRTKRNSITTQVVIYSHDPYRGTEGHFVLQCPIDGDIVTQHRCKITCDLANIRTFDAAHATTSANVPGLQLIIKRESHVSVACHALRTLYRCIDCKQFIKAKVRECPQGHHACARCVNGAGHMCYKKAVDPSDMKLLKFVPKGAELECLFPCAYEEQGCKMKIPLHSGHVQLCDFQTVPCPDKGCPHAQCYSDLEAHVREFHPENFVCSKTRTAFCEVDVLYIKTYCFYVCYGEVFYETFVIEKGIEPAPENEWYTWRVSGFNEEFIFTVDLCTDDGSKRLSVTEECGEDIKLNQTMLDDFIECEEIKYSVRIDKKPSNAQCDDDDQS